MDLGAFLLAMASGEVVAAEHVASGDSPDGYAAFNIVLPGTVLAGHLIVLWTTNSTPPTSGSGQAWSTISVAGASLHYRVLSAADIAAPIATNGGCAWSVYRGATALAVRTSGNVAGDGPTLVGFTKSADCAGLLYVGYGTTNTAYPTPGALGVTRQTWRAIGGGAPGTHIAIGDVLPPSAYTDGASIVTGGSSNGHTYAAFLELLA